MRMQIRLPGGTLKIKTYSRLRTHEMERRVPVWKWGDLYFIWLRDGPHPEREERT